LGSNQQIFVKLQMLNMVSEKSISLMLAIHRFVSLINNLEMGK